ncbi:hypothetical protein L6452_40517 [Arctium lappa]|uniref:Uncharacterized protein n=1 Tax=Arctium lappa TaxID=4217 RepID=A0ACB8XMW6_ARCLA|nr:hypothetical protein L6452_40517 [Arctium lappa]
MRRSSGLAVVDVKSSLVELIAVLVETFYRLTTSNEMPSMMQSHFAWAVGNLYGWGWDNSLSICSSRPCDRLMVGVLVGSVLSFRKQNTKRTPGLNEDSFPTKSCKRRRK